VVEGFKRLSGHGRGFTDVKSVRLGVHPNELVFETSFGEVEATFQVKGDDFTLYYGGRAVHFSAKHVLGRPN
jgi:hypothetical protein